MLEVPGSPVENRRQNLQANLVMFQSQSYRMKPKTRGFRNNPFYNKTASALTASRRSILQPAEVWNQRRRKMPLESARARLRH